MLSSTLRHPHPGEWSQWFSSVDKTSRSRHLKGFLEFQECPSGRSHDPDGQRASEAPVASQPIAWAYSFLSRRVAGRAEMMRTTSSETSSRYVCTTTRIMIFSIEPIACQRSSPSVTRSTNVTQQGSSKTSCAVSKSIPCFVRLISFFARSHSIRTCIYSIVHTTAKDSQSKKAKKSRHFTLGAGAFRPGPDQRAGAF